MTANGNGENGSILERLDAEIAAHEARLGELRAARRVLVELMGGAPYRSTPTPGAILRESVPEHAFRSAPRAGKAVATERGGPGRLSDPSLNVTDAAAIVLRVHARPMDAPSIARAMLAMGYPYDKPLQTLRRTVRGVLGRELRENPDTPLAKAGRGLFALKEWGLDEEEEQATAALFDSSEEEEEDEAADRT